ncbi:T9SS type A sorting domain-containing protein [Adhaeribacter soli]|uniref:T9SS type A sorting domain-containing protein n=1 Tax=Adhaeribacter soli TaxID=2607655 RepID=A0A5N1J0X9_9BACT|nr:T9SS type A sorting domain-containing protein [Adhaeribacter soli]KAA9340058.1 T9SS type A sorting domain-containing protein [Adhaeribacter soli]
MKNALYFFSFLGAFFIFINGSAQTPAWQWVVNSPDSFHQSRCLTTDAAGNIYVAGTALTKRSPAGMLLWSKPLQTSAFTATVHGLVSDSAGNIYIAGTFSGALNFDTITLNYFGHSDIFIAKFNTNGQVIWASKAGTPGPPSSPQPPAVTDIASGIAIDAAGNCYITGQCYAYNQNPVFDHITIPGNNTGDYFFFAAKYNATGQVLWVRSVTMGEPLSIGCGPKGSYYITGGNYPNGIFTEKYHASGARAWFRNTSGIIQDFSTSISVNKTGDCYITGAITGNTTFSGATLQKTGSSNMFLAKYSNAGVLEWALQNQNLAAGSCFGEQVVADETGRVFVTGAFSSYAAFGSLPTLTATGNDPDIFVAEFSELGQPEWAVQAGGTGSDYGKGIAPLANGECYISGRFDPVVGASFGSINFPPSPGNNNTFFLAKLSAGTLGVPEAGTKTHFQLYPNAATSGVTITGHLKPGTLEIVSLTGQKVYEAKLIAGTKLNVEDWPAGMYLVKITSEGNTRVEKLLVTH